ncbi:hypothetical protein BO71DRAFT_403709 [Aspergillus ellipticus CBS 707.79]|uniref:Uncharacterized protein n=1 Tax=Aspergillus ellipticus CBS 707.79 TaxID=1448320 RepID=A0A319CTX8_9EURO|nr:hypothetical protein BO71DRAFT_403709 [Aspergillus ellipticus CBS 707.79]
MILFNSILASVGDRTTPILRRIEQGSRWRASEAGEKYFSKDSFEDRKPSDLRELFQLLVLLKNNIASLQVLIEQWECRESSQGRERPRRTRNDEQKYRKAIKQKVAQFEDHVCVIKSIAGRIEFLITLVNNAEEAIRSKKSLQEAENITLFTYVTVFFLPVGLAVSIFSMSGAPPHNVLIDMVVTAAIALLVTVGVLWCVLNHMVPISVIEYMTRNRSNQQIKEMGPTKDISRMDRNLDTRFLRLLSRAPRDRDGSTGRNDDIEGQTRHGSESESVKST